MLKHKVSGTKFLGKVQMDKKTIRDVDVSGKRVLVRVDFNVPLSEGEVTDDTRIRATLPTINYLLENGAKVILMSHLGRPKGVEEKYRLDPVAKVLSGLLQKEVKKVDKTVSDEAKKAVSELEPGNVLLLENLRFNPGEEKNDPHFAKELASLGDIYVNDAFGVAHRTHASVTGVTHHLPSVAGFLLEKEVRELYALLEHPKRPFFAVLGGNKISDKIGVIHKFLELVDGLVTGGGIGYTFLKAKGVYIGQSICEDEELEHARAMLKKAEKNGVKIYIPLDAVVTKEFDPDAYYKVVPIGEIPKGWMGLDIGPKTIKTYKEALKEAKTIFWNGPLGVFEMASFDRGTRSIAEAIVSSSATTIVGGGDSDAALRQYGLEDKVSYISTGGGASLKFLEGNSLPGIDALLDKTSVQNKVKN